MGGLTQALTEGGFSGQIVCSEADASFVLAGRTTKGGYAVYDYRYRYRPPNAAVDHGGQRILVFRDGAYLGQYAASPPPYVSVSVRDDEVRLASTAAGESSVLDFSVAPPPEALVSGREASFFR